jgi:quercetin dioxygenase-like cupin family protein
MEVTKSTRQTGIGPKNCFTGTVFIDPIKDPNEQSSVGCAHVRFSPGARTAWHKHPKGQTLYVTDGVGYVCRRGGAAVIRFLLSQMKSIGMAHYPTDLWHT